MSHTIATWEPGTDVTLCNVPWNSDYRDIVKFDTDAEFNTYIDESAGTHVAIDRMTYAKPGMPVKVNLPYNAANKYNYLRVRNTAPGDIAKTFYYFILDVEYSAPSTTTLHIQLDVWQTFHNDVEFGNCYIERGHIGIANANQMNDNGREFLTIPEGLDVGGEYAIEHNSNYKLGETDSNSGVSIDIIVTTTVSFLQSGGTIDAPVINTAQGSDFEGLPNGAELYYFPSVAAFKTFMTAISSMPWVSQGIISVMAMPSLDLPVGSWQEFTGAGGIVYKRLVTKNIHPKVITLISNWRTTVANPSRYANLKKFFTYPYRVIELTTYSGTPLMLKPESVGTNDLSVVQLFHVAPPAPRIAFYPYRYNASDSAPIEQDDDLNIVNDGAEFLDMMTGIFNFPTFSLVNNGYMSYMAANANSIAYQHTSADWSQQRALQGNELGFNQASQSITTSQIMNQLGLNAGTASNNLTNDTAIMKAALGGATSIVGGIPGGPAGVAMGAGSAATTGLNAAIDMNQRNQQLAINQQLSRAQTGTQTGNQGFMRDSNKDFADYAAKGDYQNTIAGINAKIQDARMVQPTTSGQMGGDAFNLAVYRWALHAKVKVIQGAAMAAIGEYWLRYGYQVNRFATPPASLMVMEKFTYWKLRETYIRSSSCPEVYRQTIRGIFEKGVTVWASPDDMGMIDIADNAPLTGVTL